MQPARVGVGKDGVSYCVIFSRKQNSRKRLPGII